MTATVPSTTPPRPGRDQGDDSLSSTPMISVDPDRMHGEPCFAGTRVPVRTMFDHLRAGDPIEAFLDGFPDVSRDQAVGVIDFLSERLLSNLRRS